MRNIAREKDVYMYSRGKKATGSLSAALCLQKIRTTKSTTVWRTFYRN